MAYSKKRLIAAAMAGVLAMMSAFPGYAASRKKITSVSVSIKADIEPETDFGQEIIEIESSSNRYSVDGYEILNEGFYWTEDMTPEIRITLTADDDYYFTALTKDKVNQTAIQLCFAVGCYPFFSPEQLERYGRNYFIR